MRSLERFDFSFYYHVYHCSTTYLGNNFFQFEVNNYSPQSGLMFYPYFTLNIFKAENLFHYYSHYECQHVFHTFNFLSSRVLTLLPKRQRLQSQAWHLLTKWHWAKWQNLSENINSSIWKQLDITCKPVWKLILLNNIY